MEVERVLFDPADLPIAFHPGETLEEKLIEMGMSVKDFSVASACTEESIIAILRGKRSISQNMAVAFETVTGIPTHMWLSQQKRYDEYVVRYYETKTFNNSCHYGSLL